jgi:hypothetical protein
MRRCSYLSRIARAGTEDGPSLTSARVLFRPSPIPDGHGAEAPAVSPAGVTPAESRSGGHPSELPLAPSCDADVLVTRNLSRAHLSRPPAAGSSSAVTLGVDIRPSRQVSGPVLVPSSTLLSSAKPAPRVPAKVQPPVASAEPASGGPVSVEPPFRAVRDQVPPARPGRRPKAPTRSSNEAVATFDHSSLDTMGRRQARAVQDQAPPARPDRHAKAPARPSNEVVATFDRRSLDMELPRPVTQYRSESPNDSTLVQTTFSAAPVSKRASETSPTLLIPSPPAGAEKRATISTETGPGLRIGALEVRIMPPAPVAPSAPATFNRQSVVSRPQVALSRGFRSFGLTQG